MIVYVTFYSPALHEAAGLTIGVLMAFVSSSMGFSGPVICIGGLSSAPY